MNSLLIVDDEPHIRKLLTIILEKAGFSCRSAEDVAAAKRILTETRFDLLLTDMDMPGESGIDLIRYAKEHYPLTAAVMVTVIDDPERAKEVLELGIYGYIIKPFTQNMVVITVENALRHHRLELQDKLHTKVLEREVADRTRLLNEQVNFLQTLIDAIPVPVYYKDLNLVYVGCNRAFEQVVDQRREAIIGTTATALYAPDLARALELKDLEVLSAGGLQVYENEIVQSDGLTHTGILHKASFANSQGVIAGLVGVELDITELKRTEQSLRVSEEKLRSIMDNLHIGVAMISPKMELLQVNRQMRQWFPKASAEIGACCYQVFVDHDKQEACEDCPAQKVLALGRSHESVVKMHTPGGERIFRSFASPIFDGAGSITAVIEILEDITEKLAVERELRQAQKLESIGQLAAGIAHEINTPVQYVGDNIRFLGDAFRDLLEINEKHTALLQAMKGGQPVNALIEVVEAAIELADIPFLVDEVPKTIQQSMEGINRVGTIVRAMREFSHPGSEEKNPTDINQSLTSTLTVSRNEWKYVAEVETDLALDLPLVSCLPGEMNQVFLNLIINAAHAIGDITDNGSLGKGLIRLSTCLQGNWLEIRIADSGGGIPEKVQHRIFDPFFTTKKIGKGTGQGLAIARSVVVDKHQGSIRFETEAGKGTTFFIRLPLQEPCSATHRAKPSFTA